MNSDPMNNDHVTSEQMESLLFDAMQRERSQHLRSCRECSAEVESLRSSVGDLREAAVRLAAVGALERQRRTTLMPEPSRRTQRAMWAVLAAAALICTAGPLAVRYRHDGVPVASAPMQQVRGDVSSASHDANASDEQLLTNVQADLASSVPGPMAPLEASDSSAGASGFMYSTGDNAASISATSISAASNSKENE